MENGPDLKMYILLKTATLHCYVSLLEGSFFLRESFQSTNGLGRGGLDFFKTGSPYERDCYETGTRFESQTPQSNQFTMIVGG